MCDASALGETGKEEENVIDRAQSSWTKQGEFYSEQLLLLLCFCVGNMGHHY